MGKPACHILLQLQIIDKSFDFIETIKFTPSFVEYSHSQPSWNCLFSNSSVYIFSNAITKLLKIFILVGYLGVFYTLLEFQKPMNVKVKENIHYFV